MTVSPDARTPSASVHALSGSTPPGDVRPVQPFGIATAAAAVAELPDTFAPLGVVASDVVTGLAARRAAPAHPDAEVIDLAGRVKALVSRELRLVLRTIEIEDAVMQDLPPRPERVEGTLRIVSDRTVDDDGTSVMTIREPAGWAAAFRTNREAYEAALGQRKRHEQAEEDRCGLPRWMKLRERATCRLERWGLQLAAMGPITQAGLAAKAAASVAVAEGDELPDGWHQALAISLGRDTVRINGAEADERAEQDQQADGELLALGHLWEQRVEIHHMADEAMMASWCRFLAIVPAVPEELFVSDQEYRRVRPYTSEHVTMKRRWYGNSDSIEMLRQGYPKDLGEERRERILAAYDAWINGTEAAHREAGTRETEAAETAANSEMTLARSAIMFAPARTLAGLQLKACVARQGLGDSLVMEAVERKLAKAQKSGDHLDETAMAVLLDVVRLLDAGAMPASNLRPAPLAPLEFPAGRYPAGTSRDVVETYRTFLEMELRFLNHEVYGQTEGRLHFWLDNPAGSFHGGGEPMPSSRAAAVLSLLGLMPGAADAVPLPAASAA